MWGLAGIEAAQSQQQVLEKGRETQTGALVLNLLWPGLSPTPTHNMLACVCTMLGSTLISDSSSPILHLSFWPVSGYVSFSTLPLPHHGPRLGQARAPRCDTLGS